MIAKVGIFLGGTSLGMLGMHMYHKNLNKNAPVTVHPRSDSAHHNRLQVKDSISKIPLKWEGISVPVTISDVLTRDGYATSYNRQLRNPNWVLEHLNAERLTSTGASRERSKFLEDPSIPEQFRGKLNDYYRSGYDRGHMAAAADVKFSQQAMDDTFYLTNMAPQVGAGFNREYWAYLEEFSRKLTQEFKDVYVVTGPLYMPKKDPKFPNPDKWYVQYEVIGNPPNIAVPTHFFKVILAIPKNGGTPSLGGFVLPNTEIPNETPLERFVLPVDVIEKAAGAIFFDEFGSDKVSKLPHLCKTTKCQTKLPKFIEAQKKLAGGK